MGYSTWIFSDFGSFLKRTLTRKIEVGISSNLLHSISTSICIKNVIKIGVIFWPFKKKKPWALALGIFSKIRPSLKPHTGHVHELTASANLETGSDAVTSRPGE